MKKGLKAGRPRPTSTKKKRKIHLDLPLDVELLGQELPGNHRERLKLLESLKSMVEEEGEEYVRKNKHFVLRWMQHALDTMG